MIRFNNDYNRGAHPLILKTLYEINGESFGGYGLDEICNRAKEKIKACIKKPNAKVHFLVGGTQANATVIAALLRPYEAVISADTGHIHVHETGAIENGGHKIIALPHENGKISAKQIEREAILFLESDIKEHITEPKAVYISFPTEFGTVYTKSELEEIYTVCQKYGLYLFIDGARIGYGLAAEGGDVSPLDIAENCDVFYFGGTKCGALFGEAVVFKNKETQRHFRSYIKQNGAMLAKGWLLGLQFDVLFSDNLYFDITKRAVDLAMKIKDAFKKKGIPFYLDSHTNQQFVILTEKQRGFLAEKYVFEFQEKVDDDKAVVRFCTSWSSTDEEVESLISDIEKL